MPEVANVNVDQKTIDELTKHVHEIRGYHEKMEGGIISKAEFKQYQEKIDADRLALEKRIDVMQVEKVRPPIGSGDPESKRIKSLFYESLKTGIIPDEYKQLMETKDMTVTDATTGGIFAPPVVEAEILRNVVEYSPIREIATVRSTSASEIQVPKKTGALSAAWVGEVAARTEQTGITFGLEKIPTHELAAFVDISRWDVEDPTFNLEAEINSDFIEQFGVAEGTAFVSGNGVNKPEGLLTHGSVNHAAHSGVADDITNGDCIKTLCSKVKEYYLGNARFLMNRTTRLKLELLTDGIGHYIWQTDYTQGTPGMLNGFPVTLATDMPDVAANAFPVMFGDFRRAYRIADRIGIAFLRDVYTQAANAIIRIYAWKRVGGQVVLYEAIAKLQVAVV